MLELDRHMCSQCKSSYTPCTVEFPVCSCLLTQNEPNSLDQGGIPEIRLCDIPGMFEDKLTDNLSFRFQNRR